VKESAGRTQQSHIAQTGKACRKERASIKQQNGAVHDSEIIEKWERAREISGKPDNPGNQDNIEINLKVCKESQIGDVRQNKS
jgi:hypothetical protein